MRGRIQPKNLRQQVTVERKRRNVVFFTIIILAFLYMGTTLLLGDMGLIKYLKLKKAKNNLETEITTLEKETKTLKTQINALKEDPYYIEKHAREEFGLAKPDEYIFQFQNDAKNQ
ncbi:MAG: septum formation initiator family protein [Nitrospirae bacterium]|jgi:cell division protein FtsB|nr:septum formation initiator family protein [Nitrospirota bacterium]MCL5062604.1 septum formation initiator family protein [Nitrospirota bacterium]MDA8214312.1 septum formation initiator family protein [Nitrospiraceae bacterium]MDA8338157.1 septum formation initiator family protein [Nitrospiraceae bacterium]